MRGRAAHKRRMALLAVLAVARGRPVARERLIGLLWPELTTDAARHNLSESLYVLRKELGEGAVYAVSAGDVTLDLARVASDVAEFQDRLEAGDTEGAATLYRGPLLDGFYVADAPEFERWADGERDRLARAYARALEELAQAAEAEGSVLRAVDWWRRLAAHDPFSPRTTLRLMRALEAAGEAPAALRVAETHAALLREELGVEPGADVRDLVTRLRAAPLRPPAPAVVREPARTAPSAPPAVTAPAPIPAPAPVAPPAPAVIPASQSTSAPESASPADVEEEPHAAPSLESDAEPGADVVPVPAPGPHPGSASHPVSRGDDGGASRSSAVPVAAPGAPRAPTARPAVPPAARHRRTGAQWAALGGVMLGMLLSLLTGWSRHRDAEGPGPAYDPRRIAVLYFEDLTPRGELQYLAAGLTERLIHELSQVGALDVVSRGGVRPYAGAAVHMDSLAAELRVGSVVEGTVQRSRDSVWVTVALVDANTHRRLQSREVGRPLGDVVALERAVAAEVAAALRRRLGTEVRLRAAAEETQSGEARQALLLAEQRRREAREMLAGGDSLDVGTAARLLAGADSLLVRAQAADPRWPQPVLLRGWVDTDRATLARGAAREAWLRSAGERGGQVLARGAARAEALELRGTALYRRSLDSPDSVRQRVLLDSAERDLRGAVGAQPTRANAWSTLSQLLRIRGRLAESDLAARRALAEDAYLDDAADIRHRLFFIALWQADYARARTECEAGRAQFPADPNFTECRLTLLRNDRSRPPDPGAAWRLVAELERMDPPARARAHGRFYAPFYRRMVAAAVSARAGDADSARAVVARARREVGADPGLGFSLDYDEAWVRLMLGDTAGARALVERMTRARPELRAYLQADPLVRALEAS
ncbi:BTAD domain-containing putative transcriptional regulator [Longimicrobium sp.]|uniref:BTAD domain-containing putative transcriptional regulator n=1 Tax=Longimicrobium sp. TaxID=2029185 RepID=UPI002E366F0B|nr:BTAD domain-containing putative transcriptional regulator [Longimicrobium sp.]HEX6036629.1 BTAD domain-containing putative transcriptional regulator [Longimicrobium sp.]